MIEKEEVLTENQIHPSIREQDEFLPLLPLKNVVVLPKSIQPILVGRPLSIKAVEFALKHNRSLFITAQKDPKTENPDESDLFKFGTRANILQVMRMPNGALKILAEGIVRARIEAYDDAADFIGVVAQEIPTTSLHKAVDLEASWRQLHGLYLEYAKLNEKAPTEITAMVKTPEDMDAIADTIGVHISNLTFDNRQEILETPDLVDRMLKLCHMLRKEIDILETEQRIRGHVQTQVDKNQKEYYLTEQMKAIQKELGRDDQSEEIETMRTKIASMNLPKDALEKVEKELRRLEQMPPLSSEAVVSRHYVDWITSLPWHKTTQDSISLKQAEKILNMTHAGLKKPKERIVEFLAAKKFSKNLERSPIICLVGPPGVGKTSLGKSIAESLGREFVRISLGGIRDEAEIRGHRRTYIGALPGKIVQAMKKASTMNPVILLDEIDKMSRDMHGDPAAALLEVLDPEQNKTFLDHYLDIEYDLSKVMFIATANVLDHIPYPLYDRLEIIQLSGYTDEEKFAITQQFLIPKNLAEYELTLKQFRISNDVLNFIIAEYTKEAGVRQLERIIAKLMRKTIQVLLKDKKVERVTINKELVKEWLGNPVFKKTSLNKRHDRIGLATGLAWTEVGGDVLELNELQLKLGAGYENRSPMHLCAWRAEHLHRALVRIPADNLCIETELGLIEIRRFIRILHHHDKVAADHHAVGRSRRRNRVRLRYFDEEAVRIFQHDDLILAHRHHLTADRIDGPAVLQRGCYGLVDVANAQAQIRRAGVLEPELRGMRLDVGEFGELEVPLDAGGIYRDVPEIGAVGRIRQLEDGGAGWRGFLDLCRALDIEAERIAIKSVAFIEIAHRENPLGEFDRVTGRLGRLGGLTQCKSDRRA